MRENDGTDSLPPPLPEVMPVPAGTRRVGVDVARGAAVLGLIFANIQGFASSDFYLAFLSEPPKQSLGVVLGLSFALEVVVVGKCVTILAFFLGAGLAWQEDRLAAAGGNIRRLVVRRMVVLFLIGLVHMVFLWWGDILCAYASLGLALLLVRKLGAGGRRVLAGACLVLVVLGLAAMAAIPSEEDPEFDQFIGEQIEKLDEAYRAGDFGEIVVVRFFEALVMQGMTIVFWPFSLGLVVLGYDAVRTGWFPDGSEWKQWGLGRLLALAIIGSAIAAWGSTFRPDSRVWWAVYCLVGFPAATALAWCYLVGLMHWGTRGGRGVHAVAAVGRTALTNYLLQSLVAGWVFYSYGLGYYGTMGVGTTMAVAGGIVGLQLMWSGWWLRIFRYGPMEWFWRMGTYVRWVPMRIDRTA